MLPVIRPSVLAAALAGFMMLGLFATEAATPAKKAVRSTPRPAATTARTASGEPVSPAAIPFLQQGVAAFNAKRFAEAELAFKQALAKMGPVDANKSMALDNLSSLYLRQEKFQQALPYVQKALPLLAKRYGANAIETANGHYKLGRILQEQADTAQAEAAYKRAIALYELPTNIGRYSTCHAAALHNLGILAGKRKDYETAMGWYQKTLALQERNNDPDTGAVLENMASIRNFQDREQEAIDYYRKALAAYEKRLGADSPEAKKVYFRLSNLGKPANVASVSPGSTADSTTGQDTHSARYDGHFYEVGRKAMSEKNYEEAVRLFKEALSQAQTHYPGEVRFIANLQASLGKAMYQAESEDPAEIHLEKGLAWQAKNLPANDESLLNTRLFLGLTYARKSEYDKAETQYREILAHSSDNDDGHPGNVRLMLAENLCHQGRFNEARPIYEQLLSLLQSQPQPDEQRIQSVRYQLGLLDKMAASQDQGLQQYFKYSVNGLHRWNDENSSILVHVSRGANLPGWDDRYVDFVKQAFQQWQGHLEGKQRFEFTDNPSRYDVLVNWSDQPLAKTTVDAQMGVHKLESLRGLFVKSDITLVIAKDSKRRTDADIYSTALHEIGHMLGLSHSGNLTDIMAEVGNYSHTNKTLPTLSTRDIQAVQVLYRQKPAVTNPKNITLSEYRQFVESAKPGLEALQRQDYGDAYRVLQAARDVYAEDPYINFYCGLSAFQKGDYKAARDIFENLVMPASAGLFSVDSQLGLVYVELGHKYNRWGRKNKALSGEFYDKGVHHLALALQNPELTASRRAYLIDKLHEGQTRQKPEPIYYYTTGFSPFPTFR